MTVPMDSSSAPSSRELAQRLYNKNIELETGLRKSAQSRVPSDPNAWVQMRENYEAIILEDHDFSEKHEVEYALWKLHHRRIEEFRAHINSTVSAGSQGGRIPTRPDRIKKIRIAFKSFLSEATGFYHDLILKIRSKYGLPLSYFSEGCESQIIMSKDEKKSAEMKKGLISCHRCLIYLGDLARYKGLFGEGDSISREYAAASSYYLQAASLYPSSGNPHHQLAILASYSSDDLLAVYRYFRSLATDIPFSTARDNLIIVFDKNRQSYSQLTSNTKVTSVGELYTQSTGRGSRGKSDVRPRTEHNRTESSPPKRHVLNIHEVFKAFCTRFVHLTGILFTRTSLETFEEIFSLVISDFHELLFSGPKEELRFGQDGAGDGAVIVRLIAILIFTVQNVKKDSEGQSYAEILQRSVLLQNSFTVTFEIAGYIIKRCLDLNDTASCYLVPSIMVFIEWLACHPDIAAGIDAKEKQAAARSFFWNQFVSFLNKLILTGLVSVAGNGDDDCFSEMTRYDGGETGNRLALWEDFELRGFLPLLPAHLILDFSRSHSFECESSMKEKGVRARRILAAGRALTNVARVDQHGIYFDPNLKKFVIGSKPMVYEYQMHAAQIRAPESNILKLGNLVEKVVDHRVLQSNKVRLEMARPSKHLHLEGEEEEEEIVFKPVVPEEHSNLIAVSATNGIIQHVHSSSGSDWATYGVPHTTPHSSNQMSTVIGANSQLYTPVHNAFQYPLQHISSNTSNILTEKETILSNGLNNMNIIGNGRLTKHGSHGGLSYLPPAPFSSRISSSSHLNTIGVVGERNVPNPSIPSTHDSVVPLDATFDGPGMKFTEVLPMASKKNPISRPVKHLGPPPGFTHFPSKQLDDPTNSVAKDLHLQMDDYIWRDEYQSLSTKGMMMNTNQSTDHAHNSRSNTLNSATTFPFPGKQISTVHAQRNTLNSSHNNLDHLKPYSEQQPQQSTFQNAPVPEQHQTQSLWSGRYFV